MYIIVLTTVTRMRAGIIYEVRPSANMEFMIIYMYVYV